MGLPAQRSMVSLVACVYMCVCVREKWETGFGHLSSGLSVGVGDCIFARQFKLSYLGFVSQRTK